MSFVASVFAVFSFAFGGGCFDVFSDETSFLATVGGFFSAAPSFSVASFFFGDWLVFLSGEGDMERLLLRPERYELPEEERLE